MAIMLCRKQHAEIGLDAPRNNDFDVEDKECSGALKKFEDEELEALLHKDSYQIPAKLAELLGVDHTTASKCLKVLGMIQKQGHWMPYELKPRNVERRFSRAKSCFNSRKGKVFCIIL